MKLWILRPREDLPGRKELGGDYRKDTRNPWVPWYDKCFGMIIRAEDEETARKMAQEKGQGETIILKSDGLQDVSVWDNPELSTCKPLEKEGNERVVMMDVKQA